MLPNPEVRPEQASTGTGTVATILFVRGSIRRTANGFVLATHTASSATRTQSAVPPILIVADGFRRAKGT